MDREKVQAMLEGWGEYMGACDEAVGAVLRGYHLSTELST